MPVIWIFIFHEKVKWFATLMWLYVSSGWCSVVVKIFKNQIVASLLINYFYGLQNICPERVTEDQNFSFCKIKKFRLLNTIKYFKSLVRHALQEWEGQIAQRSGRGFFQRAKRSRRKKVFAKQKGGVFQRRLKNGDGTLRTFEKYK